MQLTAIIDAMASATFALLSSCFHDFIAFPSETHALSSYNNRQAIEACIHSALPHGFKLPTSKAHLVGTGSRAA
jgi:hypothetical protein